MLVNKRELSEILKKSERTLTTYSKQGMPCAVASERGKAHQFETADVIDWLIQAEIEKIISSDDGTYDTDQERGRLLHHQANITAIDEQTRQGQLIPAETVKNRWTQIMSHVRARLLALPSNLAGTAANSGRRTVENRAQTLVYEALEELATAPDYS